MAGRSASFSVRFGTQDAEVVERALRDMGEEGQRALNKIRGSAERYNRRAAESRARTRGLSRSIGELRNVIAGVGIGLLAREFIDVADRASLLDSRLKLVTSSGREFARTQEALFAIAQSTRQSFEGTVEVFTRLARGARDVGLTTGELLQITESLNAAILASGVSAEEAQAGMIQLSQGLASGVLQGDELRSVLEQMPPVARAIANELGVTVGELRDLAAEGEVTSRVVADALIGSLNDFRAQAAEIAPTVGQGFTQINNSVLTLIDTVNDSTGATQNLAGALGGVADRLADISDWVERNGQGVGDFLSFLEGFGRFPFGPAGGLLNLQEREAGRGGAFLGGSGLSQAERNALEAGVDFTQRPAAAGQAIDTRNAAAREAVKVDTERAKLLRQIARDEVKAAEAGLEGIALVKARRDRAIAEREAAFREGLIDAEEFERARVALVETAEAQIAELRRRAAEQTRREQKRLAEAAEREFVDTIGRSTDRVVEVA